MSWSQDLRNLILYARAAPLTTTYMHAHGDLYLNKETHAFRGHIERDEIAGTYAHDPRFIHNPCTASHTRMC